MASEVGIFIFRRDFRIQDNIGLHEMSKICSSIIPIFIFTPEQITDKNKFRSQNAIQFMIEALDDLAGELTIHKSNLHCFMGDNVTIIESLVSRIGAKHICFNRDYTPYAIKRDREIAELCVKLDIQCHQFEDYYLFPPGTVRKTGATGDSFESFYRKFTPFYDKAIKSMPSIAMKKNANNLSKISLVGMTSVVKLPDMYLRFASLNPNVSQSGGRRYALDCLQDAKKSQKHYVDTHDDLTKSTSRLSAYIKFGCISIREVANALMFNKAFIRQLIWREFYAQILFIFPEVIDAWDYSQTEKEKTKIQLWKTGNTGVPIVDACMRELNETGYMHNRGRLIVASFLAKTMKIDWRIGEQYFAQQLIDYDVASNNGNWRWIASAAELRVKHGSDSSVVVHLDTQPPFRTFNPWIQSKKHDPNAEYICFWLPVLRIVEPRDIHQWNVSHVKYPHLKYPETNIETKNI